MTGIGLDADAQTGGTRARAPLTGVAARFVVLRDRDGKRHAIARHSVSAICEEDGTATLLLPAGRVVVLDMGLDDVVALLSHP